MGVLAGVGCPGAVTGGVEPLSDRSPTTRTREPGPREIGPAASEGSALDHFAFAIDDYDDARCECGYVWAVQV